LTPQESFTINRKIARKSGKKYVKNMDGICCLHNVEEAVFRVQGSYLNIEQTRKMARKSEKICK
jgi:hypothetical protein